MVFNATFKNMVLYRGGQFYWLIKLEYPEKTTDLSQLTNKPFFLTRLSLYLDINSNFSIDKMFRLLVRSKMRSLR
jgi:hypothetical protein